METSTPFFLRHGPCIRGERSFLAHIEKINDFFFINIGHQAEKRCLCIVMRRKQFLPKLGKSLPVFRGSCARAGLNG